MRLLEDRIQRDGKVKEGHVLKVDSFLNHQMDIALFTEMGKEFYRLFGSEGVTKILTIEASGIGIACITALYFHVPVLFAKKNQTKNIAGDVYTSRVESFTHGRVYEIRVAKEFLLPGDRVLIIDDFLANGSALRGLIQLVRDAGASLVGAGIAVEKGYQPEGIWFVPLECGWIAGGHRFHGRKKRRGVSPLNVLNRLRNIFRHAKGLPQKNPFCGSP